MTPKEINKKAKEAFPDGVDNERDTAMLRLGYETAYKEISALPTIKGWVARNAEVEGGQINLFASKPRRKEVNADHYINRVWLSSNFRGHISLPKTLFPDLRWEDQPKKVSVTIKAE